VSDIQSRGCGFNSQSDHYQVITAWMGDCLEIAKPFRYNIASTNVNSAFRHSGAGKLSTSLSRWEYVGISGHTGWQVTLRDFVPCDEFPVNSYTQHLTLNFYISVYIIYVYIILFSSDCRSREWWTATRERIWT